MEDHFNRLLDVEPRSSSTFLKKAFIPSARYDGSRKGYVFKKGDKGLGYYVDEVQLGTAELLGFEKNEDVESEGMEEMGVSRKRKMSGHWDGNQCTFVNLPFIGTI